MQIDVKDLKDLAGCRERIPFGLPRFQFTARIVPEGTLWRAFSAVNDSTYALLFAARLLAHLARSPWISANWWSRPTTAASSGASGIAVMACLGAGVL